MVGDDMNPLNKVSAVPDVHLQHVRIDCTVRSVQTVRSSDTDHKGAQYIKHNGVIQHQSAKIYNNDLSQTLTPQTQQPFKNSLSLTPMC